MSRKRNAKRLANYLLRAAVLLFVIISLNFFLVRAMPGDPVVHILGEEQYFTLEHQHPELLAAVRADYGLDGSVLRQYGRYVYNVVTLRFGNSYTDGQDVASVVFFRLRWTLLLSLVSVVLSAIIGGALGVLAGYYKGRKVDSVLTFFALLLDTIPANCLALIALVIFAFKLRWFPVGGMSAGGVTGWAKALSIMRHMVLPVTVLSLFRSSTNFLLMKSFASQVKDEEYIAVAAAKGLPGRKVLFRHLLRNVMVPYSTMLCMQFGYIISGSMLIEVVFSWKGMGTLIYSAVQTRDYPTVQMCFLLIAVCVVAFNFLAEIISMLIDPRIKDGAGHA